jgi:hypothetical protein
VPLHDLQKGERRAIHHERHLASRRRDDPGRHGELEGRHRRAAFLPIVRIGNVRHLGRHRRDRDQAGALDVVPTDLVPTYEL